MGQGQLAAFVLSLRYCKEGAGHDHEILALQLIELVQCLSCTCLVNAVACLLLVLKLSNVSEQSSSQSTRGHKIQAHAATK
jgi:hypothetical protein